MFFKFSIKFISLTMCGKCSSTSNLTCDPFPFTLDFVRYMFTLYSCCWFCFTDTASSATAALFFDFLISGVKYISVKGFTVINSFGTCLKASNEAAKNDTNLPCLYSALRWSRSVASSCCWRAFFSLHYSLYLLLL